MSSPADPRQPGGAHSRLDGRLMTADDVAALLRVSRPWIYSEARAGRLPHVRLGRHVRFRSEAVEAWIEALERDGGNGGGERS
jgi:excisionase family DNA binding protein